MKREALSAALIAGGKSSRMGRDKAFVEIDGLPLWRHQVGTLRALTPSEIFISGPPREEWSSFPVVADEMPGAGPLAGLAACLHQCAGTHLVVLAVDLPRITPEFFRELIEECRDVCGAVPKRSDFFEPLAAIYPKECATLAKSLLDSGERAMHVFAERAIAAGLLREHAIRDDQRALFLNLNTPEDIAAL